MWWCSVVCGVREVRERVRVRVRSKPCSFSDADDHFSASNKFGTFPHLSILRALFGCRSDFGWALKPCFSKFVDCPFALVLGIRSPKWLRTVDMVTSALCMLWQVAFGFLTSACTHGTCLGIGSIWSARKSFQKQQVLERGALTWIC